MSSDLFPGTGGEGGPCYSHPLPQETATEPGQDLYTLPLAHHAARPGPFPLAEINAVLFIHLNSLHCSPWGFAPLWTDCLRDCRISSWLLGLRQSCVPLLCLSSIRFSFVLFLLLVAVVVIILIIPVIIIIVPITTSIPASNCMESCVSLWMTLLHILSLLTQKW